MIPQSDISTIDLLQARCFNQRLCGNFCASAEEVVAWLGAVQAQEYRPSLWALGLRLGPDVTEQSVIDEIAAAKIVRTWLMRGTIHYASAADVKWIVRLLGNRVNKKYRRYYEQVGLTPAVFAIGQQVLHATLAGGIQATRKELYRAFEEAGIAEPSKRGRGSFILQYWAQEGLICFGPYRGKQQTFVLLDEWITSHKELTTDEALTMLAQRYFSSHGPATTQDFAYWSGLSIAEAKQAIQFNTGTLVRASLGGTGYWMPHAKHTPTLPGALLLPCFDEYAIGYKDRSSIMDADYREQLGYGVNNNIAVVDGRIIGTWQQSGSSDRLSPFSLVRQPSTMERQALQQAFERYARFRTM